MTLKGQRKRIVIYVNPPGLPGFGNYNLTWIEGVGSTFGLDYIYDLYYYFIPDAGIHDLLCSWQNGQQVYQSPFYTSCYVYTAVESAITINSISIFPNPTTSYFTIQKQTPENLYFNLFNVLGEKVFTTELKQETTSVENIYLPKGIYLYHISSAKNEMVKSGKLMVQ
jgi:hypothetical protein